MALLPGDAEVTVSSASHANATRASDYTVIWRAELGKRKSLPVGFHDFDVMVDFGNHFRIPHRSDAGIETAWLKQLESAPKTWDALKFRLAKIENVPIDGKHAPQLSLGLTSYLEHVGTCTESRPEADRTVLLNDGEAKFPNTYGKNAYLACALGVETTLETCDGGLVLLRRAAGVVGSVGKYNGPSGHPEPNYGRPEPYRNSLDPDDVYMNGEEVKGELFESIVRETTEETGVHADLLSEPTLIAAMVDGYGKPDLLFRIQTTLTAAQVKKKVKSASDKWESDRVAIVAAPGHEVDLNYDQAVSRAFWERCPDTMAATTRATAECLLSQQDDVDEVQSHSSECWSEYLPLWPNEFN